MLKLSAETGAHFVILGVGVAEGEAAETAQQAESKQKVVNVEGAAATDVVKRHVRVASHKDQDGKKQSLVLVTGSASPEGTALLHKPLDRKKPSLQQYASMLFKAQMKGEGADNMDSP